MLYYIAKIFEGVCLFKFPLLASLHTLKTKNESEQKRWILHWILLTLVMTLVWPVVAFLEGFLGDFIGSVLRIVIAGGILFHEKLVGDLVYQNIELGLNLSKKLYGEGRTKLQDLAKKLAGSAQACQPCEPKKE